MPKVTVYHNTESRFMPYEDGHHLVAVTSHWLPDRADLDPQAMADWAWHTFNADLDMLEADRANADGETTFLAACVYRLLQKRSLSVGDVVEIHAGNVGQWLACDSYGWRHITEPTHRSAGSRSPRPRCTSTSPPSAPLGRRQPPRLPVDRRGDLTASSAIPGNHPGRPCPAGQVPRTQHRGETHETHHVRPGRRRGVAARTLPRPA